MKIHRSKSVTSLSEQTNKLLQVPSRPSAQQNEILDKLNNNKQYLGNYYELFLLMFYNGSRISETLNIRHEQITETGQIYLIADKGSNNRLISSPSGILFYIHCKTNFIDPFHGLNRFTAYRLLKSINISLLKNGRVHESVTHIFRNHFAKNLRNIGIEDGYLAQVTGHKNKSNTDYYGKD